MAALGLTLQTGGIHANGLQEIQMVNLELGNTNMTSTSNTMLLIEKHY
jgi:hypothetical protein